MSRWLRSVGDFLEKLDTGDNEEDDVLAARDFAKELKVQDFHDDDEEPPNPETEPDPLPPLGNASDDVLEYPDVALPQEAANDVTKNQETEEGGFDDTTLGDQNFETPPRKTELVGDDEATAARHLPPATNPQQYRTPAQFEEQNFDAEISAVLEGGTDVAAPLQEGNLLDEKPHPSTIPTRVVDDGLLRELNFLKAKIKSMETEKEDITREARKLRKHMVTLNEQLEAADTELDAQRKELLKAADSLESNRKQNAATLSDTKSKHVALVKEMEQKHAAALVALKQQHVQQQDDLRQELLLMNNQNQQHAGNLGKRLEQLEDENSKLALERNDLLGQNRQLQAQHEDLAATLEDLQNRTDQYSTNEIEYENTVERQREQIEQLTKQRQRDVQILEEQVASLNMALAAAKSASAVVAAVKETALDDANAAAGVAADCEYWKGEYQSLRGQLEQEHELLNIARQDLVTLQRKKEMEAESLKREQAAARLELQERIESLESQPVAPKRATDDEKQQINALSNQVMRQQEQLSQAHGEVSALRTRLSAALNRATIAEAAAMEEAREPLRVVPFQRRKKAPTVTLKQALGGGGASVDFLDSFFSATSKILRHNPYARLLFVLYLAVLHLWTFALLVFHAHSSTAAIVPSHGPQAIMQASLQRKGP